MIIQMSNREFQEIRKFIISLDNSKVTKNFNEIFSKEVTGGVKGFVNPLNKDIIIEIPEGISFEVEKVFVNNGANLGKMIKNGVSITNASKWLSLLKGILNDIVAAITVR